MRYRIYTKPNVFLRSAGWSNTDGSPLSYSIINSRAIYKSKVNVRRQISAPTRHVAIASAYAQQEEECLFQLQYTK